MTRNKDLKKLVRARMEKTGESYTTARARIVARTATAAPAPAAPSAKAAAPPAKWAELAGHRDEVIRERTTRDWAEWVAELDAIGAAKMTHTEIARHVAGLGVSGWWAQAVTVGYERIRGLREPNQMATGEFVAGKSRTFGVPVSKLWAAVAQKRRRDAWLPGVAMKVRTRITNRSMRVTWPDGTNVELFFENKGPKKSTLIVSHGKLASRAAVVEAKAAWARRLDALAATFDAR